MARYVESVVAKQIIRNDIVGVHDSCEDKTITDLSNYNRWLSKIRTTGIKTLRVEVFFAVETSKWLKEIADKDRKEYKRENVWIEQKRIRYEHANKVGFLTGPIIDRANMEYYDKLTKYLGELKEGEVEVKKSMVCKGPE